MPEKVKAVLYPILMLVGVIIAAAAEGGEKAGTLSSGAGTSCLIAGLVLTLAPLIMETVSERREHKKAALSAETDRDGNEKRRLSNDANNRKSA